MIKKRNLDPSLIQWIMSVTGLGPGIGELFWVAPDASSSSQFRTQLQGFGVEQSDTIYTSPTAAEAAMVAYRNDIMLVMPGKYTQVAELAWDKAHSHIIGLGGPNVMGHWRTTTENDMRNVLLHTATDAVPSVLNITGENCQFHNIHVHNEGNAASNVAAVIVDKFGSYFKTVAFRGATAATPLTEVACGSLQIDGAGHFPLFEDCVIGHNTYSAGVKTGVASGHLIFSEGYPQNGRFKNCRFLLRSQTATVGLVRFAQSVSADRTWIYEDCIFDNFYMDHAALLNAVFVYQAAASPQTSNHILKNCVASGFAEWSDTDWGGGTQKQVRGAMPLTSAGGGIALALSGAVGGS